MWNFTSLSKSDSKTEFFFFFLIIGRDEKMIVSDKHAANGHRTIPPFPENTKMAMFGKWSSS